MNITRSQLYEMVWEKPVTQLAKEFGLSDVGFAKICRKHNIPLPGRGYWARVDAGYRGPKTPLPKQKNDEVIEIQKRPPVPEAEVKARRKEKAREKEMVEAVGAITVPATLESPHRLTRMTQKYYEDIVRKLEKSKTRKPSRIGYIHWEDRPPYPERGDRYICRPPAGFSMTVSLAAVPRSLLFLDTLVKALEEHGFKIRDDAKTDKGKGAIEAIKDGEGIQFHLSEGYSRRALTEEELEAARKESNFPSHYETRPNYRFTFTIHCREFSYRTEKKWGDSSKNAVGVRSHIPTFSNLRAARLTVM